MKSFSSDVLYATLTAIFTIISLVLMTRLLANNLGPEAFGVYSVARRAITLLEPITTFAMSIALTRYSALASTTEFRNDYLVPSLILTTIFTLLVLFVLSIFSDYFVNLVFGDKKYSPVYWASIFMLVSYSFFVALYSHLRGIGNTKEMNFWMIFGIALGPLMLVLFLDEDSDVSTILYGFGFLLALAFFRIAVLVSQAVRERSKRTISRTIRLAIYAAPRVPGIAAYNGLYALGPMFASFQGSIAVSGYLMLSQLILRVLEGAVEGFTRVAFPRMTQIFAQDGLAPIKSDLVDFYEMVLHLGLFIMISAFVWSKILFEVWIGSSYFEAVIALQIVSACVVPYLFYVCFKPFVDAFDEKPTITNYLYIGFLVIISLSYIVYLSGFDPLIGYSIAFSVGFIVLGLLVWYKVVTELSIKIFDRKLVVICIFNTLVALTSTILVPFLSEIQLWAQGAIMVGQGVLLFGTYLLYLNFFRIKWAGRALDLMRGLTRWRY